MGLHLGRDGRRRKLGYVPLDVLTDVGELKVSIISSGKTDKKTILYDAPTAKANEIMRLSNGTACFSLFGRKEGEWRRVRVGGVSGWIKYTQTANLYALGSQMQQRCAVLPAADADQERYVALSGEGQRIQAAI